MFSDLASHTYCLCYMRAFVFCLDAFLVFGCLLKSGLSVERKADRSILAVVVTVVGGVAVKQDVMNVILCFLDASG